MEKKPSKLVFDSTKAWYREITRIPGISFLDIVHSYIYSRWPYFYIRVATGEHPLSRLVAPLATRLIATLASHQHEPGPGAARVENDLGETFAQTYHGKVVPLEAARQLVSVKEEIQLSLPESIVPYDRARDIIFKNPDHIVVLDCPCRMAREKPCLPLDVCLIVGEPFASFMREHQPEHTRWITSEEAQAILEAENKRGHVQHAFFKDAMLGRFYAICNCCSCCCGAMQAQKNGAPMLASSGYVAQVDLALCKGCGKCARNCQFAAIQMQSLDGSNRMKAIVDPARCMGCGVCTNQCSRSAITLHRDASKGEPLEIFQLMEQSTR